MAIRRLRMRKIIEYEKNADGKIYYQLTDIGRDFLNSKKRIEIEGRYTVVVWDIPETKRTVRNLLRRRLKEWGFRSWQKSVWVSRRDVASKLRTFISEVGIEKWVGVIESEDPVLGSLFVKH
jgi:phenylacetic acid degradation operon negative regulatory protein